MKIKVHAHPATMFLASQGLISTPRQTLTKLIIREGVTRLDPSVTSAAEAHTRALLTEIEHKVSRRMGELWRFGDQDEITVSLVSERSSVHNSHHLMQVYFALVPQTPPAFRWQLLTVPFVPDQQVQHQMMVEVIVDEICRWIVKSSLLSSFEAAEESASR